MIYFYLDFEYNQVSEPKLNVLCVAYKIYDGKNLIHEGMRWLDHEADMKEFKKVFFEYHSDAVFVAYSVQAEARALYSLGLPIDLKWYDLYLEYRMLLNNNYEYSYGKQLIKGKEKFTYPPKPKYERTEEDNNLDTNKPEYGLPAACYKILGVKVDTEHKTIMRDLIIDPPEMFTPMDISNILNYCYSDIANLRDLHIALRKIFHKLYIGVDKKKYLKEAYERANYAKLTAIMESTGYPIDAEKTRNFSASVNYILYDICSEINTLFPQVSPFRLAKTEDKYHWEQKKTKEWVKTLGHSNWLKTNTGEPSLALEAFTRYYNYSHDYPSDCLGAQFVRFLKLRQSLNGFLPPKKGKKSFWDSVGSDNRVRPYLGIYGSQTARSQPAATGFIPLKAAWMRALIVPEKGRAILSMDYSQQEFLIAGVLSKDKQMITAYKSGDVYLHTAKLAKAVPEDATKKTYGKERDLFKSTVLGIQYQMGPNGLAEKISKDTGETCSVDKAEELIDSFKTSYPDFEDWRKEVIIEYQQTGYLKLPCGWTIWGDNPNHRSVGNFPIQGGGSSVMRRAVQLCRDTKLEVIYTLHDALYIEFEIGNEVRTIDRLYACMQTAFQEVLNTKVEIRLDPYLWGTDYEEQTFKTSRFEVKGYPIYIDPRAVKDYVKFYPYFSKKEEINTLLIP